MEKFDNMQHFKDHLSKTPLSFMPSDARRLEFKDGGTVIFSPWEIEWEEDTMIRRNNVTGVVEELEISNVQRDA